ncbi:MAG TPA: twin-arginine translocase subunit TatC [Gammaproteobacteria bacterium]|nr:twin-arginine translocase subunit TatC [Gammaproteobacteria bacterium]
MNALHYFIELRTRLLRCLICLVAVFALLSYKANTLYTWLSFPLLHRLPSGHLIATQVIAPFFAPFKLAFLVAVLACVPVFLYQTWQFISPALYGRERRWLWPFFVLSLVLFYAGVAFAYFLIFPLLFQFLAHAAPAGVVLMPDMNDYLNFTTQLLLVFGVLFEIPMAMVLLVGLNVITRARLVAWRSYAIVGAFIVGMLVAPPDVLSQTLLALPMWGLYELGLWLTRWVPDAKKK